MYTCIYIYIYIYICICLLPNAAEHHGRAAAEHAGHAERSAELIICIICTIISISITIIINIIIIIIIITITIIIIIIVTNTPGTPNAAPNTRPAEHAFSRTRVQIVQYSIV